MHLIAKKKREKNNGLTGNPDSCGIGLVHEGPGGNWVVDSVSIGIGSCKKKHTLLRWPAKARLRAIVPRENRPNGGNPGKDKWALSPLFAEAPMGGGMPEAGSLAPAAAGAGAERASRSPWTSLPSAAHCEAPTPSAGEEAADQRIAKAKSTTGTRGQGSQKRKEKKWGSRAQRRAGNAWPGKCMLHPVAPAQL